MAGKVHTDSEALYAVRGAITNFDSAFQGVRNDFMQSFEMINFQIDEYLRSLGNCTEECILEKNAIDREIAECAERKEVARQQKESNRSGGTDSFVCRNDACGIRIRVIEQNDTRRCSACGGTMHRVYMGCEYNKYNIEEEQLRIKEEQLQERSRNLQKQIKKNEIDEEQIKSEYKSLCEKQKFIIEQLTFKNGEDPETVVAFIDMAISNLADYQSVRFETDTESEKKKSR